MDRTLLDREQTWHVIATQRRALADLLADLSTPDWDVPSLCAGWRVRDVAAHVASVPLLPGPVPMLVATGRAGGRINRVIDRLAVEHARRPTAEIITELRDHAADRRLPPLTNHRNACFDILVHGQDIARPLGIRHEMPTAAAAAGASRVWTMGWPFRGSRRFAGFRLVATDLEWTVGAGAEIRGPIGSLLLLLTGRKIALADLSGPGLTRLKGEPNTDR
jgi:uncharacterized protein (TIGR03083 family)